MHVTSKQSMVLTTKHTPEKQLKTIKELNADEKNPASCTTAAAGHHQKPFNSPKILGLCNRYSKNDQVTFYCPRIYLSKSKPSKLQNRSKDSNASTHCGFALNIGKAQPVNPCHLLLRFVILKELWSASVCLGLDSIWPVPCYFIWVLC